MTDTKTTGWRRFGGGLTLSLLLHGLAVAVFLLSFDSPVELSPEEQAVEVTLVAPPTEPEPEPAPEPEPEPEAAEPPPEETAEAQPLPAEPEPPTPEPEPEVEPEPQPDPVEQPPVPEPELPDAASAPIPVLRPVVRFGERDSGPEIARGTEAEDEAAEEAQAEEQADEVADATPSLAQPELTLPEAPPLNGALPEAAAETNQGEGEAEASTQDEATDPAVVAAISEAQLEPRDVTELFSSAISGDRAAMTAMAGLTRQERGDQLCGTELSQQLRNGTPAYVPYFLPILRLREGNVVDVPLAAFRDVNGSWINIAVRCEVDDDATEVVRFSLSVGKAVPRAEWAERGFPDS
ncbi:DUF930 domain-containing protein [Agrobacterium sp. RAC06]|uniref:DUF930 domain-containing protein n=1 Tax=Agrobacterium sp. RAC06 TaxID=1842536 RepID=UPI000856208C|nr:DUF930 domain-containing protein [Agrobacterium sp. RAC06]AOG08929.1 hypothetical protein BSY240_4438 [Agrobacterium sp. RAC06]